MLASEMETEAARMLHEKDTYAKAIMHFDTTSRSSIDGEWPLIILRFSSAEEFRLHPMGASIRTILATKLLYYMTMTKMV